MVKYQNIPFDLSLTLSNISNSENAAPSNLSLRRYIQEKPEKTDQNTVESIGNLLSIEER
jgi:hypothetical protein